jgi:hypothetical protein
MLSEFYEATILKVRAGFGFSDFACDPGEITEALGLEPDTLSRKGEEFLLPTGKTGVRPFNSWGITSRSESKDVNVHLRDLLNRLEGKEGTLQAEFGTPSFGVTWKGNYLYAGSGPFYEADVLMGIARFGAELWQDIYQVDQEDEVGSGRFQRIPNSGFFPQSGPD